MSRLQMLRHPYSCRNCGATSYRPVIDRDASGAIRPTGMFHCSGCSVVFKDTVEWRCPSPELRSGTPSGKLRPTAVLSQ